MGKVLIYSQKAYHEDKKFGMDVEKTAKKANSPEEHMELLKKIYPKYNIIQLFTFSHSGMCIEKTRRAGYYGMDSSADAFAAYKKEEDLDEKIAEINRDLDSDDNY